MGDFIANFFELWGLAYIQDFSNHMYDAEAYKPVFWLLLAITLVVTALYYKIDNIKWAYTKVWFSIIAVTSAIVGGIGTGVASSQVSSYIYNQGLNVEIPGGDYVTFYFITFLWSLVLCFVFSCGLKYISKNSIRIPF